MTLVVRRARTEDLAELGTLLDEVDSLHAANLPWLLRPTDDPRPYSAIADFLTAEDRVALVAEAPTVVGLLLAYTRASGAVRVELGVYELNAAARAFWQTLGFETLSRRVHKTVDGAG